MSQEPNLESQTLTGNEPTGSDDEAAALFEKRLPTEPEEAKPDPESEVVEVEEGSDAEPDADVVTEDKLETVEYEGKTYSVPPELQKALLRQADYSRNMNEVGAQKKLLEERIEVAEGYAKGAEKYAEILAEVNGVTAQLKQFDTVDWANLRVQNPAEYAALAADKQTLLMSQSEAKRKAHSVNAELEQARNNLLISQRNEMIKTLSKDLKNWGDELGTKITQYAVKQGYQLNDISNITDPKWVIAMDKARKFDELQASKDSLKAKAKDAPSFVKPGTPRRTDAKVDVMARLKLDNSSASAEAAFLQRMN